MSKTCPICHGRSVNLARHGCAFCGAFVVTPGQVVARATGRPLCRATGAVSERWTCGARRQDIILHGTRSACARLVRRSL